MNISQNLPIHPSRLHPLTGAPIQAIGHRADGRLIWPIMGGSEGAPEGGTPPAGSTPPAGGSTPPSGGETPPAGGETPPAGETPPGAETPPADGKAGKVEDLPDWAQKQIRDLRKESGDRRTQANTAEQERTKLLDGIAQALGLKKGEDAPTPEQLAAQLNDAQTTGREAQVELAVFKAASTLGADPVALTDSRTFMTKVGNLDPAANNFAAKVKAEIETAISDNPKLKAGRAPGASSVDHPGGPGENRRTSSKPKSLDAAVSSHYGT